VLAVAWLGGAAFAASLGYLVYFYAIVLASPAGDPAELWSNATFDAALFSLFALHHSALARPGVKRRVAALVGEAHERSVYVWVASALLAVVCAAWQPVAGLIYDVDGIGRLALHALQLLGVWMTVRAAGAIDVLELAGIRQARRDPSHDELTVAGPFRVVRHPIYLGWMLMVFATPAMTANRLLFAAISSAYLILAIPWEEKSLVAAHGDRYRAYQQAVRWRVLPGIW
jgi:protein-S-isoprenylcysteine O-methyltransferase Ste14